MKTLPSGLKDNACQYWHQNESVTLEEAAQAYGMSRATLSRALQERGLSASFVNYKTTEESRMLQYLSNKGIDDLATLRIVV